MAFERKQIQLGEDAIKAIRKRAEADPGYGNFADRYGVGTGVSAVDPTTGKASMYFESTTPGDTAAGQEGRMLKMQNRAAYGRLAGGERGVFGGEAEVSRKAELDSVFGEARYDRPLPGPARRGGDVQTPSDVVAEVVRAGVQNDADILRKASATPTPILAAPQGEPLFKHRISEPIIARSRKSDQWDPNNPGGRPYGFPKEQAPAGLSEMDQALQAQSVKREQWTRYLRALKDYGRYETRKKYRQLPLIKDKGVYLKPKPPSFAPDGKWAGY